MQRVGETGALPLNLELPNEHPPVVGRFTWLSREHARLLRSVNGRIVAAWSGRVPRILVPDGRAVIIFEDGRFRVEWFSLKTFAQISGAQQATIQSFKGGASTGPPSDPSTTAGPQ
jgi:hypothetical protein